MTKEATVLGSTTTPSAQCTAVEAAELILKVGGPMESTKLHSLLYLAQSHHLAITDNPLFTDTIVARSEGPRVAVIEELLAGTTWVSPESLRDKLDSLVERSRNEPVEPASSAEITFTDSSPSDV